MRTCYACTKMLNEEDEPPSEAAAAPQFSAQALALVRAPKTVEDLKPLVGQAPAMRVRGGVPMPRQVASDAPIRRADEPSLFVHATPHELEARAVGHRALLYVTDACYKDGEMDLSRFDWFHGKIGKDEAEALLRDVRFFAAAARGACGGLTCGAGTQAPEGTFLMRLRTGGKGEFVLSWKKRAISHVLVKPLEDKERRANATNRFKVTAVDGTVYTYESLFHTVRTYARKHMKHYVSARAAPPTDRKLHRLRKERGDYVL